jgi:glycosyltransferase involved in cell wall biosynthesis
MQNAADLCPTLSPIFLTALEAMPALSVLFSTYNEPAWLEWVLWGYATQTMQDFEVIVVDDGSGPDTRAVIDRLRPQMPFRLRHFWQPDEGYQKCKGMNRAILLTESDYLVFSDGDCIPRHDFLAAHHALRAPKRYLTGGYCKLPLALSHAITKDDIIAGRATSYDWLAANGLERHTLKLRTLRPWQRTVLDAITPVKPRFHGHNASAWKADILQVNGWDERMQYGGQDLELGERLNHLGVRGKSIRFSAICVHLEHKRGYIRADMRKKNNAIRAHTRALRLHYTPFGIDQHRPADWHAD